MQIGSLEIKGRLFLAPMSNVTTLPFRLLCKRYGASVVYSEMINADAYLMASPKTKKRLMFLEEERPIGIQMFGSRIDVVVKAAKKIESELKPDLIDINIGCPSYEVMKTGAGAALLNDLPRISGLIGKLSSSISIPLTCKMRIKNNEEETLEIAKAIEKAGAGALTVHGRTAKQKYSGKSNWDIIKKIKEELIIPVILNGDVTDERSAENAFSYTKCDAIMIGRAAVGNPYLFKRIIHYLKTGKRLERQTFKEKTNDFLKYLDLCEKHGYTNIAAIKMQAQRSLKGFKNNKKTREKIANSKSIEKITELLSF